MSALQQELVFDAAHPPTHQQAFDHWAHTPAGGEVCNRFIRIAIGFSRRGQRIGAKAIAERLRWNAFCRKHEGEEWLINNNHISYLARFAMERAQELSDYFETREVGKEKSKRPVFIREATVIRGGLQ